MKLKNASASNSKYPVRVPFYLLFTGWTIVVFGLMGWSYNTFSTETYTLAQREAYKAFEKDVMVRTWATKHGGVYVPATEETPPNPYLSNIPERDITTPSGKKLTLMNPAYITRQVHEISFKEKGIIGHITSLLPLRKENAPDEWEVNALKSFEKGEKEYFSLSIINNEKYFRYMAPLITTKGCLKCHESQGYKLGEIRGGISSSIPWKSYQDSILVQTRNLFIGYGIIWIIGFIGISSVKKRFIIYITHRDQAENRLEKLHEDLLESKKIIEENLIQKDKLVAELTDTKDKLEKINSEKDKLFSIIAHDLKSPFQGFLGLTELMAEEGDNFTKEEIAAFSKEINQSATNLLKLLQNLLEWARMQKGTIEFDPKEIELKSIVAENIGIIYKRGEQKGIVITLDISTDRKVFADIALLNSILRNLLSNAIKFSTKGGKVIVSSKENETGMIEISIKDNGIGIPDEILKRLFKLGEKVGRLGTGGEKSTGLGLLLCKEFVEKNGGSIWVESTMGKGSTFYFTLPKSK